MLLSLAIANLSLLIYVFITGCLYPKKVDVGDIASKSSRKIPCCSFGTISIPYLTTKIRK